MAERMGYDLEDYASVGFDLILGADVIRLPDVQFVGDMLALTNRIAEINAVRGVPVSIQYAVDTHDTGHPGIDTNPVRFGARGMLLRFFLARFGNCGGGRRPKYEVIGNQDLSHGLYEANNRPVSLDWADDLAFFRTYQTIENVYRRFRTALERSYLREFHVADHHAYWFLDRADGFRMRLVCLCNPDMGEDGETVEKLRIFPFEQYGFDCAHVDQVMLDSGALDYVPLEPDGHFLVDRLLPGEVRLFWIHEDGSDLPEGGG
jgi:hypothetical protein